MEKSLRGIAQRELADAKMRNSGQKPILKKISKEQVDLKKIFFLVMLPNMVQTFGQLQLTYIYLNTIIFKSLFSYFFNTLKGQTGYVRQLN